MIRTTEQQAPKVVAELIARLTALTTNLPTTTDLEEALPASRDITRALFEWLASRYAAHDAAKRLGLDGSSAREA